METWVWLAKAELLWKCLLGIVAALVLGGIFWSSEASLRISGYVLQLFGMVCTIKGLLAIREHFNHPRLWLLLVEWISEFPRIRQDVAAQAGTGRYEPQGYPPQINTSKSDDPHLPINERIALLASKVEDLRVCQFEQTTLIRRMGEEIRTLRNTLSDSTARLEVEFHSKLESSHTSDLFISLVGLVWLTIGITMSTLAPEIHRMLH